MTRTQDADLAPPYRSGPWPAEAGPLESLSVRWLNPLGLVGLAVYNFLMRLATLGIYHFWGKTEVRRRIWSGIRLNGEPLEYTGTGRELFTGFLVILGLIVVPTMLVTLAAAVLLGPQSAAFRVFQLLLYAGFFFLTGIAIYRAQRFRLSRTRWRGIRASLEGSSLSYGWTHFWTLLTLPLTLGWSAPWRSTKLQRLITNDMRFGTRPFQFSASSKPLYLPFAVYWLLMVLLFALVMAVVGGSTATLIGPLEDGKPTPAPAPGKVAALVVIVYGTLFVAGLLYMVLSAWYRATMTRHFARHTHLDGLAFESTVTGRGLLWISVSNYLILMLGAAVVTLLLTALATFAWRALGPDIIGPQGSPAIVTGLGFVFLLSTSLLLPVTQARATGYQVRNLQLSGGLDMTSVAAGAEPTSKTGEGLAQAFDIDAL